MIAWPGDRILKSPFFLGLISEFLCRPGPKCPVWDQFGRFCIKTTSVLEPTYCNPEKECFRVDADRCHTPKCGRTNCFREWQGREAEKQNSDPEVLFKIHHLPERESKSWKKPYPSQSPQQYNGWESFLAAPVPASLRQPGEWTLLG